MKETQLYQPVKDLLIQRGYDVKAEVKDIDVFASKGEQIVLVELKTSLNLALILQGAKRQRLSDQVYVAIPKPSFKIRCSKNFKDKEYLLRRLSLGLILVDTSLMTATVQFEPGPFDQAISQGKSKKKRLKALKEADKRSGDYNTGGTNQKIMTAYKENAYLIAGLLAQGPLQVKEIRARGGGEKTQSILSKNYYKWFVRVKRGTYDLTPAGQEAAKTYQVFQVERSL